MENAFKMKRKLLYAVSIILMAWSATSCEALGECKFCKIVTKENGQVTSESGETEYCGAELIAIQAKGSTTVGSVTTSYECR